MSHKSPFTFRPPSIWPRLLGYHNFIWEVFNFYVSTQNYFWYIFILLAHKQAHAQKMDKAPPNLSEKYKVTYTNIVLRRNWDFLKVLNIFLKAFFFQNFIKLYTNSESLIQIKNHNRTLYFFEIGLHFSKSKILRKFSFFTRAKLAEILKYKGWKLKKW